MAIADKLDNSNSKSNGKHGGSRAGAGRKPGTKNPETIMKEAALAAFRQRVMKKANDLFNAQFTLATGTQMLFVIHTDSKGVRRKPEMITNTDVIARFLDENEGVDGPMDNGYDADSKCEDYYFLTTAPPNNQALESLLNRAFGKAQESVDVTTDGDRLPGSFVGYVIPGITPSGSDRED